MQALVLAGGEGTRLRPLTSTMPKPVVPLVDRPFLAFMLDWLKRHDVDHVVLSCGYLASGVRNVLGDGSAYGLRLDYVEEQSPLGTGGAVKYAAELLDERFLVLNGDVLTDMDLTAQIARHEASGARATLGLIGVEDPSTYGLVRTDAEGLVTAFLEKPSPDQIDTNLINAGAYVLERDVLDLMPPTGPCSIERDVFPKLIGKGLVGHPHEAYWLDIGTPARYLEGTWDILEGRVETPVMERLGDGYLHIAERVKSKGRIVPPALVESGVRIGAGAQVGSRVVLGDDVSIGARSHVEQAVIMRGAKIGADCRLSSCIVGAGARIGDHCVIDGGAVLGEGATLGAHNELTAGARLFPGVELPDEAIRF